LRGGADLVVGSSVDLAVGGPRQEPQPRHHLEAVDVQVLDGSAAGGEAADEAVEETWRLVLVLHAPGDALADDGGGVEARGGRVGLELVVEQLRHGLTAGEAGEEQHVLAQGRVEGEQSGVLLVGWHGSVTARPLPALRARSGCPRRGKQTSRARGARRRGRHRQTSITRPWRWAGTTWPGRAWPACSSGP